MLNEFEEVKSKPNSNDESGSEDDEDNELHNSFRGDGEDKGEEHDFPVAKTSANRRIKQKTGKLGKIQNSIVALISPKSGVQPGAPGPGSLRRESFGK